jgi:hypothetical protein
MGIRVHRVIGYGLTDIQHKRGTINDSRFNMDRFDALCYGDEKKYTVARFLRWLRCNRRRLAQLAEKEAHRRCTPRDHKMDEGLFLMNYLPQSPRLRGPQMFEYLKQKYLYFYKAVIYAHEFGKSNIMVFRPFGCAEEWTRYDNIIDYCEETVHYNSRSRVKSLAPLCGIYPYIGTMVRVRDPKIGLLPALEKLGREAEYSPEIKVDEHGLAVALQGGFYNRLVGRWDKRQPAVAQGIFLDHLLNDWRPYLPTELLWLLTYMNDQGCFNDVEAIKRDLRPLLYVYWC